MLTRIYPPSAPCAVLLCSPSGRIMAEGITEPGQWPLELARQLYARAHPVFARYKLCSTITSENPSIYGAHNVDIGRPDLMKGVIWLDSIVMVVTPVLG